jgi:hypothetical protein
LVEVIKVSPTALKGDTGPDETAVTGEGAGSDGDSAISTAA